MMTKLSQNLSLKQTLNIDIKNTIEFLKIPTMELIELVNKEIASNPFIEIIEENYQFASRYSYNSDDPYTNDNVVYVKTLHEHILEQIPYLRLSEVDKNLALEIFTLLDENGYIDEALYNQIKNKKKNEVLKMLQTLEPSGVFARNLKECLWLQLGEKKNDKIFLTILDKLEIVAEGVISKIVKALDSNEYEVLNILKLLKNLNPKPGSNFLSSHTDALQPDVYVEKSENNELKVSINRDIIPQIKHLNIDKSTKKSESEINSLVENAKKLVYNIENRFKTIEKIMYSIVLLQKAFFIHGFTRVRSLALREVAEMCNLSESTISRAISNKYFNCEYGTYSLKILFNSGVESRVTGEKFGKEQIKCLIKQFIKESNKKLSDEDIRIILSQQKIDIARRTINKYRREIK